ncbi:MAG: RagB/SusD family nutrient uptake outer membrane protein, partial [Flavobacteriaceae bacterium]|nr:RagB/SusD family nutrient uptake outer membrane protein [Flavobacteriaceae bacterium]
MKKNKKYIIASLIAVLMLTISCEDFDELVNPNEMTVDTFWQTEGDAVKGVNAVYSSLQLPGVYKKWMIFLT